MFIYVVNLPPHASPPTLSDDLRTLFSAYGLVSEVGVKKETAHGHAVAYAFVEMPDLRQAQQAIRSLNAFELDGHQLVVVEALPASAGGHRPKWTPLSLV